ncbi:MAG TPA: hypothetical protein VKE74_14490 [Gemmataceae bacterium]|nr:hypothetical protein [Gemmataceae bacterium]
MNNYADHSITTLMICDHGMSGVQGVGSGQTPDLLPYTNLSSEHIQVSTATVPADGPPGSWRRPGSGPEQMVLYLMCLANGGFACSPQTKHLAAFARKIKIGGNLFLSGCSVGKGEEGRKLLQGLGLWLQNSIRVVASKHDTSWTDVSKPVIYPARLTTGKARPRLTSSDVIGYVGRRPLGASELQSVLDVTNILSTGT